MTIRAIFFDMDGVLVDAKQWHYEALNRALVLFGMEINLYDHLSTFDGLPTREKLKALSNTRNLPLELHELINQLKQKFTRELIEISCKPNFLHQYALSKLKGEGMIVGVCSNSMRRTISHMMELTRLDSYLDFILSSEDVSQPKPSSEMYLRACEMYQLIPKECVIIEDSEHGLKAAYASGCNVLPVQNVNDVNYGNISSFILSLDRQSSPLF
ncbi:HAD family phosphatase [Limnothrix sp. FACHB-881]|uniref:HAD family hydrolase n=1 Tax=Limnothrix sp. FACHB-881 TaxID=2692819 RepID=UPI001687A384|nr:HAD family phosphatase [Limnothrix sp. FACHB-881]MBD2633878.1 HAD family phosphatase [Limnothrix sp. FACHB-881]